jgi:ABC-type transport system substrate-binding protein
VKIRRWLRWVVIAFALAAAVAACGSTSTSSKPAAASPEPTSEPTSGSAAQKQITANWTEFFDPKTPVDRRIALLEDGQTFAPVIKSQAGSALASQASASVSKVAVTSANQAAVGYSILLAGKPVLAGQSGTAVYQDGMWKVGASSFCGLLTVESGGSAVSLPAACKASP